MDDTSSQSSGTAWHLPLSLLGFAMALFILAQIWGSGAENQGIDLQTSALNETKTRLEELIKKNTTELEERKPLVAQSENIQQQFKDDTDKVKKLSTSAAQFEALHKQIADMNKLLEERKSQVTRSEELQNQFTELVKAVDALSQAGDQDATNMLKDAKALLGLQLNPGAGGAAKPDDKKPDDKKSEEKPDDKKPAPPKTP